MKARKLNRRDFLRASALAAAGAALSACNLQEGLGGLGKGGRGVTLKIIAGHNVESFLEGEDENNNAIVTYLEENSGFDLEYTILPGEDAQTKLNLLLADPNPPDILQTGSFQDLLFQEALADITDYVKDAPTLQSFIPKETWAATTVDGRIYGVPIPQNQHISGTSGVMARKDWFEEMGIQDPVTVDEYYAVMQRLRDERGVIPLTGSGARIEGFLGAFGVATQYVEKGGELVDAFVQPEAKAYLQYMNKLYSEGLMDPDWPVNASGDVQEKVVSEQAAMVVAGWWSALPIDRNLKDKNPDSNLLYLAPPKGPGGQGLARRGPVRNYVMVPAGSKHIKEAVEFIDFMCQEDTRTFVAFGDEGVHFERKNGEVFLLDEYQNRRWQIYYVMVDTQEAFAVRLRDKGFKIYSDQVAPYGTIDPIASYAPPIDKVVAVSADITSTVDEFFMRFIAGDLPLDDWDAYVQAWKDAGGEQAQSALNDWYQTSYKK